MEWCPAWSPNSNTLNFFPSDSMSLQEDHNGKHDTRQQKVQCNTDATVCIMIWNGKNIYNTPEVWQAHYRTHCQFLPVSCHLPNKEHNRCVYLMMLSNVKIIEHQWHTNKQVWNTTGTIMTCDNRETRVLETLYPPQIPHGHTGTEPETMLERPTPKNRSHGTAGTARTHQNIIILAHTLLNVQGSHDCSRDIFGMQLITSFQTVLYITQVHFNVLICTIPSLRYNHSRLNVRD
jgi:hypothetical protein